MTLFRISCLLLLSVFVNYSFADYVRGCYFANWGMYRPDRGAFTPKDIPAGLCTHIFYAFAVMNSDFTTKVFDSWADLDKDGGQYKQVVDLKKAQPNLKVLLSFGGWLFSQGQMSLLQSMASSKQNRQTFIKSIIQMLKQYNFDGFDIDWEYPTSETKSSYTQFVQDLRQAFDAQKPRLLLTAAVSAGIPTIDAGYDGPALGKAFDFLNIMTYDFQEPSMTSFNSPLNDRNGNKLSVKTGVEYWASKGVPKNKIIVGLANYGHGYTIQSTSNTGVGVPGTMSPPLKYSEEGGMAFYYELCDMLNQGAKRVWDDKQQVPYLVKGNLWYGYDDPQSFTAKLNWVKQNGYGGAFVWALHYDDFNGKSCKGNQKYPLTWKMNEILGSGEPPVTSKPPTGTTKSPSTDPQPNTNGKVITTGSPTKPPPTKPPPTKPPPSGKFTCPDQGLYPDPESCISYYSCGSGNIAVKMNCGIGLYFNPTTKNCDWPDNVKCTASG